MPGPTDARFTPAYLEELIRLSELAVWERDIWPYCLLHWSRTEDLRSLANGLLQTVQNGSRASANLEDIRKSSSQRCDQRALVAQGRGRVTQAGYPDPLSCDCGGRRATIRMASISAALHWRWAACVRRAKITLLEPSDALEKSIGIVSYQRVRNSATYSFFIIKGITPSNQLSYVVHVAAEEQGILVTGDAGFVEFKQEQKRTYHPALLQALSPLHVVQIAHHGGKAAYFYRVLRDANYPQTDSFLLLSHATRDKHRPSREFREFAEYARRDPELIRMLFTARSAGGTFVYSRNSFTPPWDPPAIKTTSGSNYQEGTWLRDLTLDPLTLKQLVHD